LQIITTRETHVLLRKSPVVAGTVAWGGAVVTVVVTGEVDADSVGSVGGTNRE